MKLRRDGKYGEELIRRFKVAIRYILFQRKKYRVVIFHETEERYKIRRGIKLPFRNWHEEFDKFLAEHSKVSKILTLMRSF